MTTGAATSPASPSVVDAALPRWHDIDVDDDEAQGAIRPPEEAGDALPASALRAKAREEEEEGGLGRRRRRGCATGRRVECPHCRASLAPTVDAHFQHSGRFPDCYPAVLRGLSDAGRAEFAERREREWARTAAAKASVMVAPRAVARRVLLPSSDVRLAGRCVLCHAVGVVDLERHYRQEHGVIKATGLELLGSIKAVAESWARAAGVEQP